MIIINIYKLLKKLLISHYKMQFSTEPAEIIVQYTTKNNGHLQIRSAFDN